MSVTPLPDHRDTTHLIVGKRLFHLVIAISACAIVLFAAICYRIIFSDSLDMAAAITALILFGLAMGVGVVVASANTRHGHGTSDVPTTDTAEATTIMAADPTGRDALTDLANRSHLHQRLVELIEGNKTPAAFALLVMDLDRFKEVNNTLGHHIGDQLLVQVATRLKEVAPHADICARLGGDAFAILLTMANGHAALVTARKIQASLEIPVALNNIEIDIRASIGIALYPDHGDDADGFFRRAEIAMYHAKRRSLGVVTYSADIDPYNVRRLALLGELRSAIEHQQLLLHYQPKVDLTTNRTVGVEALVRWKHPKHGMIPPGEFVPLAEQNDVIRNLTYWVIDEALLQCHAWRQKGLALNVAVNLSARNLHDPRLPVKIAVLLAKWSVPASFITFEITENAIMIDPERALKILLRLDHMGINLSIDDFGTGYSSLIYLKKLPVTQIKVDRSFVMHMTKDEDDSVIVQSTIDLGHHMNCQVVAEGVEDKETLERLRALGCDHAQGYYMSRPLPAESITAWFSESQWGIATRSVAPQENPAQLNLPQSRLHSQ